MHACIHVYIYTYIQYIFLRIYYIRDVRPKRQALQLLEGLKSDTDADSSIEVPYLLAMTACARARAKDKVNELFQEGKRNANFRVK